LGVAYPLRCPSCQALVVDRRSAVCTTCRQALPAEWVMSPAQVAKTNQLDLKARAQYAESIRTLNPLTNPDAPALVQMLNVSSIPGNP
jgi:hypothetical protein